jgi:hypothetical protein
MADTVAHLVDRVLPEAPLRQYVLSLPFALRCRLACDQELCNEVLRIFIHAVFSSLKRRARRTLRLRRRPGIRPPRRRLKAFPRAHRDDAPVGRVDLQRAPMGELRRAPRSFSPLPG